MSTEKRRIRKIGRKVVADSWALTQQRSNHRRLMLSSTIQLRDYQLTTTYNNILMISVFPEFRITQLYVYRTCRS